MSQKQKKQVNLLTSVKGHFVREACSGQRAKGLRGTAAAGVTSHGAWPALPSRGSVMPFALLLWCFLCVCWSQPTILCFLLPFPLPKSIYEGSFGCGHLKERRASGLVFCENTASVYRALFVSSPCRLPRAGGDCENVAAAPSAVLGGEWRGMRFTFLA